MPYEESYLSFAGRKIKETLKMQEGSRAFWNPKDATRRTEKPTTKLKVGEKDPELGAPLVCPIDGTQHDSREELNSHMKSEHGTELQEEKSFKGKFPFAPR